jgi:RNA polymerase sigma factor (sigma-70 family)
MASQRAEIRNLTSLGASEPDPHLVTDLHEKRGQALFGLSLRLGLSVEDAHEAVQETMLRLWSALSAGQSIARLDAWAFRVLYRLCIDHHRRNRAASTLRRDLGERGGQIAAVLETSTDAMAVWSEVDRLPERQRIVLYLRYRADLPYEGVAEVLGISASGARSQASAALSTLRRRLAGRGEGP